MEDTKFLQGLRHLCLSFVDLLERRLGIEPRTAEIRRWYKSDYRRKMELENAETPPAVEAVAAD